MALQLPQRSLLTLTATRTVRTVPSAPRNVLRSRNRIATTPLLVSIPGSQRGLRTTSSSSLIAGTGTRKGDYLGLSRYCGDHGRYLQVRYQSNTTKGETPVFRQWKFEDITSTLPKNPNTPSPPHSPILIDVREPAELYTTGIIPGAVSIPLGSQPDAYFLTADEFETRFGFPKPGIVVEEETTGTKATAGEESTALSSPIVFYCKAGVRAKAAAQLAMQAGYDPARIGVYEGSWLDWMDKGGKVEAWEGERE